QALGEDAGEAGAMVLGAAEKGRVELRSLVEPVHVRLPREADPAMRLDRAGGDFASRVGGGSLGHRGRLGKPLGVRVSGPRRIGGRRAGLLGFEQHLRAAMRYGLV